MCVRGRFRNKFHDRLAILAWINSSRADYFFCIKSEGLDLVSGRRRWMALDAPGWQGWHHVHRMRDVLKTEELDIPEGVEITIKSRVIIVKGPRGTLTKNVRHVNMDIQVVKGKTSKVSLAVWQGGRKHVACLNTIRSLINNMVTGVTKVFQLHAWNTLSSTIFRQGFQYKMRAVYAHFPINCIIQDEGNALEIRNFLGEKVGSHIVVSAISWRSFCRLSDTWTCLTASRL